MKKTIAVVTGSRAEFGLLASVMHAIDSHNFLQLKTIVTGTHLTTGSWKDVCDRGFVIHARVPMQKKDATGYAADVEALSRGVGGLGKAFAQVGAQVVVVLGDRIEAFAAAAAATVGGYRVAHLHGGDRAEGVADEAMRHAITKLGHLHFPATAQSRRRILRMGENPEHVRLAGSPAMDDLNNVQTAEDCPELIVMQHPIGADDDQEKQWMLATLDAVAGYSCLVMAPNRDPGCRGIETALRERKTAFCAHLSRPAFLAKLKGAKAIVGNSSAGLIEAAALRTACVNIGPRQAGREKPNHVIDCAYGQKAVAGAVRKALRLDTKTFRHPYGRGGTGEKIATYLAEVDLATVPLRKRNGY